MFRIDLLSIVRSLNTVFPAICICHTSYVACLLSRSVNDSCTLTIYVLLFNLLPKHLVTPHFEKSAVPYSYNKSQQDALFLNIILAKKKLYIFRTDLLSIISSLNTVFTAIGICHASYVDCLLARLRWN